jgi:glutamine amidotransferase-like uncharacterized protein
VGRRAFVLGLIGIFAAACATRDPAPADVLLFTGHGTSAGDVAAFIDLLRDGGIRYTTASSTQLDAIGASTLKTYRLILIPGGNFVEIGNGLSAATAAKIRGAIDSGVNYLGVCGGAFFAGASPYNGLNLTGGIAFPFYALEARGVRRAPVVMTPAIGAPLEVYWEDGPQLTGWGEPIAKYPDGTPAIVQGRFGAGWVLLTGVHPEAPESWRRGLPFTAAASQSRAYAAALVDAALNRTTPIAPPR